MEQLGRLPELGQEEQTRVDRVIATLSSLGERGETVAEIAHDARNMVTALDLYCDLLQQPGVLADPFTHYGGELRLVAAASRRLVEKLSATEEGVAEKFDPSTIDSRALPPFTGPRAGRAEVWKSIPAEPVRNLAEELLANRHLLASLAGPTIGLTVDVQGGALPIRMTGEDLTRVLINLTRNAAEAMSGVGRIHISLRESSGDPGNSPWVTINVEDNGPGLTDQVLGRIFKPEPAERSGNTMAGGWPMAHRGMGLSITRSLIEAAGGVIHAANRDPVGACFQIELPVSH
ncbi:sensor histidine kinase [Occallatibacter savannae]|uniref:sensor histidine kinase n=1 Tax=Occallatibacter savannae TaxID=1002691 RepID=UPI0013A57F7D|nr:sensor histidine kinase [Occallatibacter savannae]